MPRSAPEFWDRGGVLPTLLTPLGWGYALGGAIHRATARPWRAPVPVICVGNLVVGGAGKTPVAMTLARRLAQRGERPHFVTRGYGGANAGPLRVELNRHHFRDVGDEALLLAAVAPTWVARERARGARRAVSMGASALILDDGLQNPNLVQDLKFLVVDGAYGFGNRRVVPAGPLRELICSGLRRADAVVVLGDDKHGLAELARRKPVLRARLAPRADAPSLTGERVVAFAGIGRPEKFFRFLEELGAQLMSRHAFPDHHAYEPEELGELLSEAETAGARLVTTEKDLIRVPLSRRPSILAFPVEIVWENESALDGLINRLALKARVRG